MYPLASSTTFLGPPIYLSGKNSSTKFIPCTQCKRRWAYISPQVCTNRKSIPTMKSKKRTRSHSTSNSSSNSLPNNEPIRVNVESSTLSLRQQLKLASARRETDQPSKPIVRTKFRRKRDNQFIERHDTNRDTNLPSGKYKIDMDPLIFIDAYNVIGAWPKLKKWRDKADLETARVLLLNDIAEFSHVRGWDCIAVFDAYGTDEDLKVETTAQNVKVVYTGSETADSYIERCVYEFCEDGNRQIWAATSDIAQLRYSTSKGAHVMSSSLFIQEMKRAKKETKERVEESDGAAVRGKMFISNVDANTRHKLYQLRDKLDGG